MPRLLTTILRIIAASSATMFFATAAQAKYSAIDTVPVFDSDGNRVIDENGYAVSRPVRIDFEGYCDTQVNVGEECDLTYGLPYAVIFGANETNQVLLRDDGILDFVFGPPADVDQFSSDEALTQRFEVLATFDTGNRGAGYPQLAQFQLEGSSFLATWFVCPSPGVTCRTGQHTARFTPGAGGFRISYTTVSGDVQTSFLAAEFDPPQVTAVPEPSSWGLMILGFGGVGALLRSRRRHPAGRPGR